MKNISFIMLFLYASSLIASSYSNDARNLNNHFKSNFNSAIVSPGTSNANFKTLDGSKEFQANLTCDGSTISIADITYSGTSDISIQIKSDLNADGIKERTNTLSGISGICSDGLVKCNTGTWSNCSYFKYDFSSSMGIYLTQTTKTNSTNCYCINSSCGSPASTNKKQILDDITASVYNILQANMPRLILTRTTNDGVTSSIYGENQDACNNYQTGPATYSYNEKNATHIQNAGQNMLSSEQNDTNTTAGFLMKATQNENSIDYSQDKQALKTRYSSIPKATESNKIVTVGTEVFDMTRIEDGDAIVYCQIQRTVQNSQVYTDDTTAYTSPTSNLQTVEYELRECIGVNKNICPYETGESIKYPCGTVNQNSFIESVGAMQTIQSIANDMSCSTN